MQRGSLAASTACLLLALAAGIVLLLQVRVQVSGVGASCGAPFDVITGRADWQTWYAEDLGDPRLDRQQPTLIRTERCPTAVNHRTLLAGALGATALLAGGATVALARRNRPTPERARLRTLGGWVTGIGVALTAAGVAGLVVLLANPAAALFLYIDRWVVAIVGLIMLVPAMALAAGGRALMIGARTNDDRSTDHEQA